VRDPRCGLAISEGEGDPASRGLSLLGTVCSLTGDGLPGGELEPEDLDPPGE